MLIEVVYAGAAGPVAKAYRFEPPACVRDALTRAAADPEFSAVDFTRCAFGVWGVIARAERQLTDGDRVEIYRELPQDPKIARRRRAAAGARRR